MSVRFPTEWMAMASSPSGTGDDDRPPLHAVGRQDRHLRLVDDRQRHGRAERPRVRDRERAAGDLVGRQLLRPGPCRQVADLTGDGAQPLAVGLPDDRHHQALEVEVDGDPEVDVVVDDQLVLAERGVDLGVLGDGVDDGPRDERQVGEPEALGGAPLVLRRPAHPLDGFEVGLDRRVHVSGGRLRADHVLGGPAADVRVRDGGVALARLRRRWSAGRAASTAPPRAPARREPPRWPRPRRARQEPSPCRLLLRRPSGRRRV